MEKDQRHGLMAQAIKVTMLMARSMEQAASLGLMEVLTQDSSTTITQKAWEYINGQTVENMMANGKTTKWKVLVFSHGPMEENMKVNTQMTKKKAQESFTGQMAESTMANGTMASSTVWGLTHQLQARLNKVNGMRARGLNG